MVEVRYEGSRAGKVGELTVTGRSVFAIYSDGARIESEGEKLTFTSSEPGIADFVDGGIPGVIMGYKPGNTHVIIYGSEAGVGFSIPFYFTVQPE